MKTKTLLEGIREKYEEARLKRDVAKTKASRDWYQNLMDGYAHHFKNCGG